MKKNIILVLILSLGAILSACQAVSSQPTPTVEITSEPTPSPTLEPTPSPEPSFRALFIVGNQFGNTYFDMKTELESLGFWVETAGVGGRDLLSSCPNHEDIPITPDYDISEITEDNINNYQLVFIPAGKHHRSIQYSKDVERVLLLSKEKGLYISSVCAGNIVLAAMEGLIEGYEIACSSYTKTFVKDAGGIVKYSLFVVDGQFITGSSGGGNHANAPIEDMAEEIRKLITGE